MEHQITCGNVITEFRSNRDRQPNQLAIPISASWKRIHSKISREKSGSSKKSSDLGIEPVKWVRGPESHLNWIGNAVEIELNPLLVSNHRLRTDDVELGSSRTEGTVRANSAHCEGISPLVNDKCNWSLIHIIPRHSAPWRT